MRWFWQAVEQYMRWCGDRHTDGEHGEVVTPRGRKQQ
jgi:hypothetical protein